MILEKGGVKIGIIGVVTSGITTWDKTNLENAGVSVTDPVKEVSKYAKKLRGQVDVLVAACHMGLEKEKGLEDSGARDLAAAVPELDLILASHGHKQEEVTENNILITENLDSGKTANLVTLTLEKDADSGYRVTDRSNQFIEAKEYSAAPEISEDKLIQSADTRAKKYAEEVVVRLTNDSLALEDEIPGLAQTKLQDSALVRLINDVQMHYSGCEIAATAMTAKPAALHKGDVMRKDIAGIYPFENTLFKVRMTGSQISKWLEYSAGFFNKFQEGDLTVSVNPDIPPYEYVMFGGLDYEIDISQPAGSRVRHLTLEDGSPLDPDGEYDVITNNYLANLHLLAKGKVFGEGEDLPVLIEADVNDRLGSIRDMIADYMLKVRGVRGEDGITEFTAEEITEENANWKVTGFHWDAEKHARAVKLVQEGRINIEEYQDQFGNTIKPITEDDLAAAER